MQLIQTKQRVIASIDWTQTPSHEITTIKTHPTTDLLHPVLSERRRILLKHDDVLLGKVRWGEALKKKIEPKAVEN